MTDPLALWSVALAGFGAALGLYFAAALLLKQPAQAANLFLAAFCACFALLMVGDVAVIASGPQLGAWAGNALDWAFLMLAPLFYLYVRTLILGVRPRQAMVLLSLAPAAAFLLWFGLRLVLPLSAEPGAGAGTAEFMPAAYTILFVVVALVQLVAYGLAVYRLVRAHARGAEQRYSSLQAVNLQWVLALVWGAAAAALFWVLGIAIHHPGWALLNSALPPLMVLLLGVLAQRQAPLAPAEQPEAPPTPATAKYAKSSLTEERMQALAHQLAQFMSQDKAFLEGDLTLGALSSRTGVPQHQLSQVLNQHLGCSFFEYVNRLRVEEAKRCMADPAFQGQTVLELGLAAGFNSKAAFNAAFKRHTGTTPTEYRAQVR